MSENTTRAAMEQLLRETEQAISAGRRAQDKAQQILSSLRAAKGWGWADMLGGGMIVSMIKHSRMDDAQEKINELRALLNTFNRELRDVSVRCDALAEMDGFWRAADIFFDGALGDIMALSRISQAQQDVERVSYQISRILSALDKTKADLRARLG